MKNDVLRVGIIGCGRIAGEFEDLTDQHPCTIAGAFDALPETRIVSAASRGQERLERFGRRWKVHALYRDYRQMLDRESLDIVAVAIHPPLHPEMVVAAAAAGAKGIFCEKPMALSLAECDQMLAACQVGQVPMLINCTRRWSGTFEAARAVVQDNSLGQLLFIEAHCHGGKPTPQWVADTEGPLLHDAIHHLDLLRFFGGEVSSVWGTATRRFRHDLPVEDSSFSIFRHANGVESIMIVDELTEYSSGKVCLHFNRGLIELNDQRCERFTMACDASTAEAEWNSLVSAGPLKPTWSEPSILAAARDLVRCVRQGGQPRCSGYDGRAAVELNMAIYESQRRGNTWVSLPLKIDGRLLDVLRSEGFYSVAAGAKEVL